MLERIFEQVNKQINIDEMLYRITEVNTSINIAVQIYCTTVVLSYGNADNNPKQIFMLITEMRRSVNSCVLSYLTMDNPCKPLPLLETLIVDRK